MTPSPTPQERFRGALVGLAAGDALGAAVEFKPPGSFTPVTGMRAGGPHGLKAGQWTDDTSMALCLAESLLETGRFDARDQMQRYCRWYRHGYHSCTGACFDIGNATAAALAQFEATGDPLSGSDDPRRAGNGSIMRLAPVPMYYVRDPAAAIRMAADSSHTTHSSRTCIDGCRYLAGLIVGALNGVDKATLLAAQYSPASDRWTAAPLCAEIAAVAGGSFKSKRPPRIRGSGYVVESLEAALWAFHHSSSFAEGCLLAVNLGDDADTTGAVYGQVAGAFYGMSESNGLPLGIPAEWLQVLAMRPLLVNFADRLRAAAQAD